MNELIKINYTSENPTVSGRELHEKLGVGTEYMKWFERMCEYDFSENRDYLVFVKNDENPKGGRPSTDHVLTLDMAKELCMIQRSEAGKRFRLYFIEVEKAWNEPAKVMARALEIANRVLRGTQEENVKLNAQVAELAPKARFADAVSASDTDILIGELAKIIRGNGVEIGEKRLFVWLRDNGYLIKRLGTDYNAPTQKSMELGLFRVKETSITHSDGHVTVNKTTKVTGKGQQYFVNKFLSERVSA